MFEELKSIVIFGVLTVDQEIALHYLSKRDYPALNVLVEKALDSEEIKGNPTRLQAAGTLKQFLKTKLQMYEKIFEEVPFDVISDNTNTNNYEGEEFS